ncbi:MAG: hypothetical protein HRT77_12400 [Halioglobus sp.]|nr:hypothetical protein [Halioglobus sp.]
MEQKKWSGHLRWNSLSGARLRAATCALGCCLLLSGCPSASNPTQSQKPPTPSGSPPPIGSAGSSTGSAGGGAGQPSTGSASTRSGSQSTDAGQGSQDASSGAAPGTAASSSDASAGDSELSTPGSQGSGGDTGSIAADASASVFGEAAGDASLPDLRDEPSLEDSPPGSLADQPDVPGPGAPGTFGTDGSGQQASAPGHSPGGTYGPAGLPSATDSGPLTPAEQVAILDAQLEQGVGEFDAIILETEAEQREIAREQAVNRPPLNSRQGGGDMRDSPYGEGMASADGYSTGGGGMGGVARGGSIPQNTAKYPPPADIPRGDDDDVVARQLREAAMREPDPAVREKLWDEYRKYKGIE